MPDTFLDKLLIFIFRFLGKFFGILFEKKSRFCIAYLSENLFQENFLWLGTECTNLSFRLAYVSK